MLDHATSPEKILYTLLKSAIKAARPQTCLPPHMPTATSGKTLVVGAGKAAASMAQAFEAHWQGAPISGLVVTRYGHAVPTQSITVIEASHPVPDQAGRDAAKAIISQASALGKDDQLICLLSGGGSALLTLPSNGISLADKQNINQQLLRSGADITEINCVRKHLSAIKGGLLAAAAYPAKVSTLAISDVVGDDPTTIASGPTVADPTRQNDARRILETYKIMLSEAISTHLNTPNFETLKANDPRLDQTQYTLIATPKASLHAAAEIAKTHGYTVLDLGDSVSGDARQVAKEHAKLALAARAKGEKLCILSGGETTVTVTGSGRGGRNSTYALSLLQEFKGAQGIHAIACDTDGIDGSEDNAGAWISPETWEYAQKHSLSIEDHLRHNDAYTFFETVDNLVMTGPTLTNVNDFRAILVSP